MKGKVTSPNAGLFRTHKAYSPEEILTAGGASAFGQNSGKNNLKLVEALKKSPVAEAFTNEEWEQTLRQLSDSK